MRESVQKIPDWLKIQFSIVQAGVLMTHTELVCEYYSKIQRFFFYLSKYHVTRRRNVGFSRIQCDRAYDKIKNE